MTEFQIKIQVTKRVNQHYILYCNIMFCSIILHFIDVCRPSLLDTRDHTAAPEDRNKPAWWRVDLGDFYDVYVVKIYNRDQNLGKCFHFLNNTPTRTILWVWC